MYVKYLTEGKRIMFKKLAALAVIVSSTASIANAETKIGVSYISNTVNISGFGKLSADGYGINIISEGESKFSTSIGYSSISEQGLTLSVFSSIVGYDLINDLDLNTGSGNRLRAGIGYSRVETSGLGINDTEGSVIAGLDYDIALSKDITMDLSLSGIVDDFVPTYGIGIGYNVGNGKVSAGYAFNEQTIGSTKVEVTGFTIGYTIGF